MTRRITCFAALAIAAFGSMPASATDRQADTMTIAMNEPIVARTAPGVLHVAIDPAAERGPADVKADISIDTTDAADYSDRGHFQAERGFLELALDDLSEAARLARQSRDDIQQKILMRTFETTKAADAEGLKDGFSRVAYYR